MIIFIFGDSITQGMWDTKGGWADRIKTYIHTKEVKSGIKNYHEVYNLGVDGNTTKQIIERFENEVQARSWPEETYVFIFATGINDTLHRKSKDFESTPSRYKEELRKITKLAKKYSNKICFLDINPVNEALTNPTKYTIGESFTNERINKFNSILHEHCDKNKILCIRINELFRQERDYNKLLIDGLHPNDKGHQIICNKVLPVVQKFVGD